MRCCFAAGAALGEAPGVGCISNGIIRNNNKRRTGGECVDGSVWSGELSQTVIHANIQTIHALSEREEVLMHKTNSI